MFGYGEIRDAPDYTPVCVRCGHEWYLHKYVSSLGTQPIIYKCFYTYELPPPQVAEFQQCACESQYGTMTLSELRAKRAMGWEPAERRWLDATTRDGTGRER